jgi:tight adherence protein C
MSASNLMLYSLLPCAIGYYLPRYWVNKRVNKRQTEIIEGFPDALDLMLVCVEAGQSLDQSLIRVGKESRAGYPALADEFDMVAQEVKAGKERTSVLKDLAERVGVPDVASFVTTLVQSATFGTSVADALRVYSADMRDKRVMRAEEKANMLPTKLTLGTMMFTVPPLLVILIGPSVHGMVVMMTELAGGL